MEKYFRASDTFQRLMDERAKKLIEECENEEESCLYTSTTLYFWLRSVRLWRRVFVVAPIVLGSFAGWSLLDRPDIEWLTWITAGCAFLAGLIPAIYEALKMDVHIDDIARHAAELKNLQDRFRQAGTVTSRGPFEDFKAEFERLMERMEKARETSITPPERFFGKARKKIKAGHYAFDAEEKRKSGAAG